MQFRDYHVVEASALPVAQSWVALPVCWRNRLEFLREGHPQRVRDQQRAEHWLIRITHRYHREGRPVQTIFAR